MNVSFRETKFDEDARMLFHAVMTSVAPLIEVMCWLDR